MSGSSFIESVVEEARSLAELFSGIRRDRRTERFGREDMSSRCGVASQSAARPRRNSSSVAPHRADRDDMPVPLQSARHDIDLTALLLEEVSKRENSSSTQDTFLARVLDTS
jgi:hypothetical protein